MQCGVIWTLAEDDKVSVRNIKMGSMSDFEGQSDEYVEKDIEMSNRGKGVYKSHRHVSLDILEMKFQREGDVYNFNYAYGRCHGFGHRKGEVGYDKNDEVVMQQCLCDKVGLRDKKHLMRDEKNAHRPLTQKNCKEKLLTRSDENINR